MKLLAILTLSAATWIASPWARAAGAITAAQAPGALDAPSQQALDRTREMLTHPALRKQAIKDTQGAQSADLQAAQAVGGSAANTEMLYGISADIFQDLAKAAGGDPIKMQELLEQAKKDPQGFAEHLSEKNRRAIRELSGKVPGGDGGLLPKP